MNPIPDPGDLPASYRAAMRGLASTVCVITAQTAAGPRGMTATAVMSLSVDPPTVAVAINRAASLNPELLEGAALAIHFLSEGQADIAKVFAGGLPPAQRFSVGWWSADGWGTPRLEDTSASLSCVVNQRVELSSHSLLIARVRAARTAPALRPLVYAQGDFTALAPADRRRTA